MSLGNLLNQFLGAASSLSSPETSKQGNNPQSQSSQQSGALTSGAVTGSVMALLAGNKKTKKFASKAAVYGGAAMLGGLAYNAIKKYQQNQPQSGGTQNSWQSSASDYESPEVMTADFQVTLIKGMIAAAKADGHIDSTEQARLYKAIERMELSPETKAIVLDQIHQPVSLRELARGVVSEEQKTELYVASCLAIDIDNQAERMHLEKLAVVLGIPSELATCMQEEAQQALASTPG
ncbi:tellurite resistance TerB family protein [Corallincola platygyrae]|uniref:Tellurite resistance TerB family protein n=1 Tax=Corallincola platygyrae TaxID=1193278 RepID=A0ABW4XQG5_9GAMM